MPSMLKKRRFAFPHPSLAEAQLEPIIQPLFSMAVIDNAAFTGQRETFFFRYSVGQPISGLAAAAGTFASSIIHTNMDTAGFIASPKVFLVSGLRVLISGLDSVLVDALESGTQGAAEVPDESSVTDMLEIIYGTYHRFFVGTKDYAIAPTWAFPCNTGVGGLVAVDISGIAAQGPDFTSVTAPNTAGKYYGLGDHRVLIPSQQNFFTSLIAPQAVPPTPATELAIYSILDGVLGREVQ